MSGDVKKFGEKRVMGNPAWRKGPDGKGLSGNPGGRPKAHLIMSKLIAEKTANGAQLVELAHDVVMGTHAMSTDPASWRYCHDWLTVRMAGKAPLEIKVSESETEAFVMPNVRNLSLEDLRQLAEGKSDELPPAPEDGDGTGHVH